MGVVVCILEVVSNVVVRTGELLKYEGHRLPHDVGEDVKAATVGHADYEGVGPKLRGQVDAILEGGNDGLPTVKTEPLGGVKLSGEEGLEGVGEAEPLENVELLVFVELREGGGAGGLGDVSI